MFSTLVSVVSQTIPDSLDSLAKLQLGGDPPRPPPHPWAAPFAASAESAKQRAAVDAGGGASAEPAPACRAAPVRDAAVATLVSSNEGYPAGALAIGAALEALGSRLRRVAMVTPAVEGGIRTLLAGGSWEVVEVGEVRCNQVLGAGVTADKYDLGEDYQRKKAKWLTTCAAAQFGANSAQFRAIL